MLFEPYFHNNLGKFLAHVILNKCRKPAILKYNIFFTFIHVLLQIKSQPPGGHRVSYDQTRRR